MKFKNALASPDFKDHIERTLDLIQQWKTLCDNPSSRWNVSQQAFDNVFREARRLTDMMQSSKRLVIIDTKRGKNLDVQLLYAVKEDDAPMSTFADPILPGELVGNMRHSNDFTDIRQISVVPTMDEILCKNAPPLPYAATKMQVAPHWLAQGTERLIDIQFRLLREDLLASYRVGIKTFLGALKKSDWKKKLGFGMRFRGSLSKDDVEDAIITSNDVDLFVYDNVAIDSPILDKHKGTFWRFGFNQPLSGKNKPNLHRFWENSQRLIVGALVCLLWKVDDADRLEFADRVMADGYAMLFGTVVDRQKEQLEKDEARAMIGVSFVEEMAQHLLIRQLMKKDRQQKSQHVLVEVKKVMFEAYRPVLKSLQGIIPGTLPFAEYLAPNETNPITAMKPPMYTTRRQHFAFNLNCLTESQNQLDVVRGYRGVVQGDIPLLDPHNPISKGNVWRALLEHTTLDEGQCQALVACLSSEVALIQGPPGTGKSYIGVKIVQALLANQAIISSKPILVVCFTNHALDQFLTHLLDIGITNMVRLGGRTTDERIAELQLNQGKRQMPFELYKEKKQTLGEIENIQKEMNEIMSSIADTNTIGWPLLKRHLDSFHQHQMESLSDGPYEAYEYISDPNTFYTCQVDFKKASKKDLRKFWLEMQDLKCAEQAKKKTKLPPSKGKGIPMGQVATTNKFGMLDATEEGSDNAQDNPDKETDDEWEVDDEWEEFMVKDLAELLVRSMPVQVRDLDELVNTDDVWKMNQQERKLLHDFWQQQIRANVTQSLLALEDETKRLMEHIKALMNDSDKTILSATKIIGATTSGAAKYDRLIKAVGPKIVICEEAGEVLEAHTLTALSPDTEHLILIGYV
jgi:flagellar biosynthesis GTPase FlhF